MKKQLVITGLLLLFALLPAAAQRTDSMRYYRRADGRRLNIETVNRDSVGITRCGGSMRWTAGW